LVAIVVAGVLGWVISAVWRAEMEETVRRANMVDAILLVFGDFGVSGAFGSSCCELDGHLRTGERDEHYEQRRPVENDGII
jgi:hypothetical protein